MTNVRTRMIIMCGCVCVCLSVYVRTHAAHRSFLLRLFSINNTQTKFMEKCIKLLYRTRSLLLRWNLDLDFVCLFFFVVAVAVCWLVGVFGWLFALRSSPCKCLFRSLAIIRPWLKWHSLVLAHIANLQMRNFRISHLIPFEWFALCALAAIIY